MEKPMYEILSNDIEMVEDMIDALMIAPKGDKLYPMGNKCALAVDHIHECVLMIMNMRLSVRQKKWHYL